MKNIYLYINVPFCIKRCNYCYCTLAFLDEDLFSWKKNSDRYVRSILKEISGFNGSNHNCLGISFGGGTPSLLEVSQIETIFNAAMKSCSSIEEKVQISIEIFPGTKSRDELKTLHSLGFNRTSIGAQSFNDDELHQMGRPHNKRAIFQTYDDLCAAGFDNINIDIMFGLPIGNLSSWMNTVDEAIRLKPTHLTAYYWFITNGCNFFYQIKNGYIKLTSREECINQYKYVIDKTKEDGLNFYYDYNFCREKKYEYAIEREMFRHFPVRGFGPNAWSQDGNLKITNSQNLLSYFLNPFSRTIQEFPIDVYMLHTLMYPQGMLFSEFENIYKLKWRVKLLSEKLRKSFLLWNDNHFIDIDEIGIRFKKITWEQSAIYLAEFQTKAWYCPEEELIHFDKG